MLFAGHGVESRYTFVCIGLLTVYSETTAQSLAATLGFIGLYDDVQNEVLEQIVSVVGYDRDPVCTSFSYLSILRFPTLFVKAHPLTHYST
jgi:hypothetical protein